MTEREPHALLSRWVGTVAAAVVLVVLYRLGRGPLAAPPVLHPARISEWAGQRSAPTMAFALLRFTGLLAGSYLLVATALGLLARLSGRATLVAITDLATLPALRKMLGVMVGAGLTASVSATALLPLSNVSSQPGISVVAGRVDSGSVRLERLPDGATTTDRTSHGDQSGKPDDTATMTVVLPVEPVEPDAPVEAVGHAEPVQPSAGRWTVRPGDNFWHVAEATLATAWGRAPNAQETEQYWQRLIDHNRDALAVPGDPDLIYSGQVFELPLPPAQP